MKMFGVIFTLLRDLVWSTPLNHFQDCVTVCGQKLSVCFFSLQKDTKEDMIYNKQC